MFRCRSWLIATTLLPLWSCLGCCQDRAAKTSYFEPSSASHAIFNPDSSPALAADFDRSDWPVAYSDEVTAESLAYREHHVDVYGRGFAHDDGFLYRRFESNRWGRGRR